MQAAALETLRREGYATPYPLKFEVDHRTARELLVFRLWSPDYQTTTSWTSLGSIYLSLLREVDPVGAAVGLDRMRRLIERDGTFWEVLDARGRPWRSGEPALDQRHVDVVGRDPAGDARASGGSAVAGRQLAAGMKKGPAGPLRRSWPDPRSGHWRYFLAPPFGAAFVGAAFAALLAGAGLALVSPST